MEGKLLNFQKYIAHTYVVEHYLEYHCAFFFREKLCGGVSDNAANVCKAFRDLKIPNRLNCFCHIINLVFTDGKKACPAVTKLFEKFSSIVTLTKVNYFHMLHSVEISELGVGID